MDPSQITAVVVTRGGYDIAEVLEPLASFGELILWDNSAVPDRKVYGRYLAARQARFEVIYTQDDDCVVDAAAIAVAYEPGVIVANSDPHHRETNRALYRDDIALIGWGAVFDKPLAEAALRRYHERFPAHDELFDRECDRVFTGLNGLRLVEVPFRHLERAEAPDRMWREPNHLKDFAEIRRRIDLAKESIAA